MCTDSPTETGNSSWFMSRVMTVRESWEVAARRETRSYFSALRAVMVRVSSKSWVSVVVAILEEVPLGVELDWAVVVEEVRL